MDTRAGPDSPRRRAASARKANASGSPKKPVVLLVDDDAASLRLLRRALSKEPVCLLATRNPWKALEWVERRGVRLILSDQRMPGMRGTTLLEEVARRSPGTRRLLMTGNPESPEVRRAHGGAAQDVIPKPWDEDVLRRAVRSGLGAAREEHR